MALRKSTPCNGRASRACQQSVARRVGWCGESGKASQRQGVFKLRSREHILGKRTALIKTGEIVALLMNSAPIMFGI